MGIRSQAQALRRAGFRLQGPRGKCVARCWAPSVLLSLETSPPEGTRAGHSHLSEGKQARHKAALPQQATSLGKSVEKEAVCPVESRSGEEYTDASCHLPLWGESWCGESSTGDAGGQK